MLKTIALYTTMRLEMPLKKARAIGWIVIFLIALSNICPAQDIAVPSQYYSLNEGLSDRMVNDILQSRFGYVWIATPNGLNKFDGYEFTIFSDSPSSKNKYRISGSNIKRLEEDVDGDIVIIYENILHFFDLLNPQTHKYVKVNLRFDDLIGRVRDIHVNNKGEVLILTISENKSRIYQYQKEEDKLIELVAIEEKHKNQSQEVQFIQLISEMFFINDEELGLRYVDPKGNIIKSFDREDFVSSKRYPGKASFLHEDVMGRVWLAFHNQAGVFQFNPSDTVFEIVESVPKTGYFINIWEDKKKNILLGRTKKRASNPSLDDLFCIPLNGDPENFTHLLKPVGSRIVSAYSEDFFKTIFFGINTGLKVVQINRSKIKTFLTTDIEADERGSSSIGGITGDGQGTIYFSRESDYWYALDTRMDMLDTLILRDSTGRVLNFDCGYDLYLDKNKNELWGISCKNSRSGQIHCYDLSECIVTTYSPDNHSFKVKSFTVDRNGVFWLACEPDGQKGQLFSFNPVTKGFLIFEDQSIKDRNPLRGASPHFIMEDSRGMLWVGTENGLIRVDRESRSSQIFNMQEENNIGFSSNAIYVIHEDKEGLLWLGTKNGLNVFNPQTKDVAIYYKENGRAGSTIRGILPDEKGNYWISTVNGLSYFNTDPEVDAPFRNFYHIDGLSNDEFNNFSYHQDENGRYYFGGVNGLNAFYAKDLLKTEDIPTVFITNITRYNSKKQALIEQDTNLWGLEELELSPYDTYFQLHFSLPIYTSPERNTYRARLKGYEENWISLGKNPFLRYNSLPHGNYTLLIRGADPNGNFSEEDFSLYIKVKPMFYQTWTFFFIMFGLLVGLLYLLFQYQLEQGLKVERFRMKLSSDLHDEVSGLLSGIAMQTDVLQMLAKDENSKQRLKTIGEVSRKAMSKMSDVIWSIDSRKDRVSDLIHRMLEHADDILLPMSIRYDFNVGKIDKTQKLPVNIRQNLYFIYKEAINNIAKHSNASEVSINLGNNGTGFEMQVHDNGNGKAKPSVKTGQGISNIQMRAQRINARLEINKENGYTIYLKMKKFA